MRLTVLLFLFTSLNLSAQTTLLPNRNERAKELIHVLNRTKDSLKLECAFQIKTVTFTNANFREFHLVKNYKIDLSLHAIPKGRSTVIVVTSSKIIVFNLIKSK